MSTRVFTSASVSIGGTIELDDQESHYLVKVRRAAIGDACELLDGDRIWSAAVSHVGRLASVRVESAIDRPDPPERVLLLGLPDVSATLDAATLACEAGASTIVFVGCARSQGRLPTQPRIARVLLATQRQCGRPRLPTLLGLDEPLTLATALHLRAELPGWFGWEREPGSLVTPPPPTGGLRLLVGPEGGFVEREVDEIRAAGFRPIGLGPWILRTPTAVVALLARSWPSS